MTAITIGKRLKDFMKSDGSECGASASDARVLEFERKFGVVIPEDLRSYFIEVNGTAGNYAYGILRFWSIDEFRTVTQETSATRSPNHSVIQSAYSEPIDDGESFFVFADCMWDVQLYAIHLSTSDTPNNIILLDGGKPTVVAKSFSDFVERYLTSPDDLRLMT
jgi:hypothetical protein|tara:strand:+ start:85 stop:576 length:492 start_codon:yes stop_codon:yes gene_type:complete